MSSLQKAKEIIYKKKYECGECGGEGLVGGLGVEPDNCSTCSGKGYVIPPCLKGGTYFDGEQRIITGYVCESTNESEEGKYVVFRRVNSKVEYLSKEEILKIGRFKAPALSLQDVLLALSKNKLLDLEIMVNETIDILDYGQDEMEEFTIDLTKLPEDWEEETWEKIINLIK